MHDHDQQNRPAWSPDPPRPDFPRVDPRRLRMRMVERLAREGISNTAVLRAMGVPFNYAHGSVRLSLSRYTTEEEVDFVIAHMPDVIKTLRALSPFKD